MAFEQEFMHLLSGLPPWSVVIFIAMLPFIELRGSLPVAFFAYNMPLAEAFILSIIGNMIPIPFILTIFDKVEAWLRQWRWWDRRLTRLFKRTRIKAKGDIEKWGALGLATFVAIPLPFTGGWTGALIAYLFGLPKGKSLYTIFVGVWGAGVIVGALCLFFASLLGY